MTKSEKPYRSSNHSSSFTFKQLSRQNKEIKLDVMRTWFLEKYTDPVNCCPHISSEGGYQYIWGGPYDALDILSNEFIGDEYEELVKELADDLSSESPNWSPIPEEHEEDFEFYFAEGTKISDIYNEFKNSINSIKELIDLKLYKQQKRYLYRLAYANIITAMEVYLSDTFIILVTNGGSFRPSYMAHQVSKKNSKHKKIKLTDTWSHTLSKNDKINLSHFLWHKLEKTEDLYKNVLGITFEKYLARLKIPINKRHDIIHRNGKNHDGEVLDLTKKDIKELAKITHQFVSFLKAEIDRKINDPKSKNIDKNFMEDDSPF